MPEHSTVAPPSDTKVLTTAGQAYVATLRDVARRQYGVAFDGWPEAQQHSILVTIGLQTLLMCESFEVPTMNLDAVTFGAGLAIGTQSGCLQEEQMEQLLLNLTRGVAIGRQQSLAAHAAYKTVGGMQ